MAPCISKVTRSCELKKHHLPHSVVTTNDTVQNTILYNESDKFIAIDIRYHSIDLSRKLRNTTIPYFILHAHFNVLFARTELI